MLQVKIFPDFFDVMFLEDECQPGGKGQAAIKRCLFRDCICGTYCIATLFTLGSAIGLLLEERYISCIHDTVTLIGK
jgi:hypothetical protein